MPDSDPTAIHMTWFDAPARWNNSGNWLELPWEEAERRLTTPELWPGGGSVEYARNLLPGWSPAQYRNSSRAASPGESPEDADARVIGVWGLVVEYQGDPTINAEQILKRWAPWRLIATTTAHHEVPRGEQPAGPRWRLFLPYSHAIAAEEADQVAAWSRHPQRHAGAVDDTPIDAGAWFAAPALGPGGFEHVVRAEGPFLDPDQAIAELRTWIDEERLARAHHVLSGTSLVERVGMLRKRLSPTLSWPDDLELARSLGPLRAGSLVAVTGELVGARRALALALARGIGGPQTPTLLAATRCAPDELLARLLAQQPGAPAWTRLASDPQGDLEALVRAQVEARPHLHLWSPGPAGRTWTALQQEWQALCEATEGPGVLVIEDPSDLEPDASPRSLSLHLRDLAATQATAGTAPVLVAVVHLSVAPGLEPDLLLQLKVEGERARLSARASDGTEVELPLRWKADCGRISRA